jgi:hypothetical protein
MRYWNKFIDEHVTLGLACSPGENPDQQRVAEIVARSMQCGAHGRLRDEHLLGRTGDVLLAQQRIERDQQILIEAMELHAVRCR